jgi:hypothetical protein
VHDHAGLREREGQKSADGIKLQRLGKVTHLCSSEMTHLRGNQESN